MNRIDQNATRMNIRLAGCLLLLILLPAFILNAQQLQKGVSVNLVPTSSAKPAPDADQSNAWIVSVSADGHLWFGATPVTPDTLATKMTQTPRNREQNLYIKADARATYSDLANVLKAAHVVWFESAILLTGQHTSARANGLTPPMGLQVWIENGALTGPKPIDVDIANNQGSAAVKVNARDVALANLQSTIKQLSQNKLDSVVRLNAEADVSFNEVAKAVDAARSADAKVVLIIPKV